MLTTKRKPATVGEILTEEFMEPMGLTQGALAEAMGVQRKHVNELCGDRRNVTAATALILARVFGNSPDFWLNVQRRNDLWEVMNTPKERKRVRARTSVEARSMSDVMSRERPTQMPPFASICRRSYDEGKSGLLILASPPLHACLSRQTVRETAWKTKRSRARRYHTGQRQSRPGPSEPARRRDRPCGADAGAHHRPPHGAGGFRGVRRRKRQQARLLPKQRRTGPTTTERTNRP